MNVFTIHIRRLSTGETAPSMLFRGETEADARRYAEAAIAARRDAGDFVVDRVEGREGGLPRCTSNRAASMQTCRTWTYGTSRATPDYILVRIRSLLTRTASAGEDFGAAHRAGRTSSSLATTADALPPRSPLCVAGEV